MTLANNSPKNLFVVLGMARSGTSAIARGLKALGIDLGKKLTPANVQWNAKGFWEDTEIVYKINREVLTAIDYSWSTLHLTEADYDKNLDIKILKHSATRLIQKRMEHTTNWGFKDPRTANILPFWRSIFQELNLKEHYIIALRNPLSVAHSYQHVTGVDVEFGLLLWMMHAICAIEHTKEMPRMMISYEQLLQQPKLELERIKQQLFISTSTTDSEINLYVNEFLDKKLRRFSNLEAEIFTHKAMQVVPSCGKMYQLFLQVARDEINLNDATFAACWQNIKDEFMQYYPMFCYIDQLIKTNKNLQRQIRTTKKSLPWKLIYPMRIIDDTLRSIRHKARRKKRLIQSYGS